MSDDTTLRDGAAGAATHDEDNYLTAGYDWRSWLLTLDHKRIAILYLISVTAFFLIGGAMAVLIRLELPDPER